MASTLTVRRSSPVTLEVPTDEFRNHPIPHFGKAAKVGTCYVRVTDLPNLDDWLGVNPRVPKRNDKNVLVGQPIKGIIETLEESPEDMAIKNLGLFLLVESAEHERRSGGNHVLKITMSDPDRHGLANGGHTYAAIWNCIENRDNIADLDSAYVRLHVYQGIPQDKVAEMAEGLNRSKQVDDPSLMNLDGLFDEIKNVMAGRLGADKIAYRQGDRGDYYVTEILLYLELFNCERFSETQHPYGLYRYQKKLLKLFEDDVRMAPSPMKLLVPRLPEILVLSDKIRLAVPEAARKHCNFEIGRMKPDPKRKERAASPKNRNTFLPFLGETMSCRVPNGWLLPMLASFRANVEWDLENSVFQWKVPLDKLLDGTIADIVRVCVIAHRDSGQKPEDIGKNPQIYEQCFDKVALYLLRRKK